jgi:hypothetical protein
MAAFFLALLLSLCVKKGQRLLTFVVLWLLFAVFGLHWWLLMAVTVPLSLLVAPVL